MEPKYKVYPLTEKDIKIIISSCTIWEGCKMKGLRDKALILFGYYSGGRRRSEIANLKFNDLIKVINGYDIKITKSKGSKKEFWCNLAGVAASSLKEWIEEAKINEGYVFRRIYKNDKVSKHGISGKTVSNIIIERCKQVEIKSNDIICAHSLRHGYITESMRKNESFQGMFQGMKQTGHKTLGGYYYYYADKDEYIDLFKSEASIMLG